MSADWLASLDPPALARAEELIRRFREVGAADPEGAARDEIEGDEPQLARQLLLHHLWAEAIDPWRDDLDWIDNLADDARRDPSGPFADAGLALRRLRDAGADPRDLGLVARFVAYESVFSVLHTLDEGYDPGREDDDPLPGWAPVERDALGHLTGRTLDGLHADLPAADPSGREGRPG
jgi:hypothetical protein